MSGAADYFTTDHLGSVREVAATTGTLLARYAFDPWGRRTVTAGTDVTTVGFTGHRTHTNAGLVLALTLTRALDLEGATRWLSEDTLGVEADGPNLYRYARNSPLRLFDPIGTSPAVAIGNAYAVKCAMSRVRNGFNRCPANEPSGDPSWERDSPAVTRALKAVGGSGTAKYRNRNGSECAYDDCGRLKPDNGSNYTYNYSPHDWSRPTTVVAHIWNDVLPHYLCFQSYVPNLTQTY